ncbi:hypothetical protein GOP47_0021437 [Adiantum capillus-veneris]|uniref:G-patch domain-containing protein n=1 Tax=Adiantum capillus-veneris TaxID=13818 RepID=A0A9D4Z6I4_ADICA|nr:hypothetical protein GOP47_0021437 [Adiantum capillus-veneris]
MAEDEARQVDESRMGTEAPPPSDSKAPLKFSFTVSKSSSSSRPPLFSKSKDADANIVEYVEVFDGKGREAQAPVKVIPLPEKSWRPEKRMKNIMVASENIPSTEERFEVETLDAGPQSSVQYGLQLKRKASESAENPREAVVDCDLQRYRDDMAVLPDEMSVDDYENVPVEEFGEALLRGMGWEKDKPIGRNSTTLAQPVVAVRRDGRHGLGAIPAPRPEKVKKFIKPGESRKTKLRVGRIMCVIAGGHAGSRGQIAEISGAYYTVALLESGKRVQVKEGELAEIGSPEEEKAMKKLADLSIDENKGYDDRSQRSFDEGRRNSHTEKEAQRGGHVNPDAGEAFDHRKHDEATRSRHVRSKSREEVDNGNGGRHRSRKDSRDKSHSHEGGKQDTSDECRHEKHKSRRDDSNNEKGDYEVAASRHDQHFCEEKGSRLETREDRSTLDAQHGKNSRTGSKSYSSDVRNKEKDISSGKAVQGGLHAEENFGITERRVESWLARDIRVRIIDRKAYGDRHYLQKACVVDVVSPSLCDIRTDDGGRIIEKVKQEHLETALPKRGGRVLVVGGKYRGQIGRLQERDPEKGMGLVQMEDDSEVLSLDLDHLAEFVGVLHDMEQ